MLVLSRKVNESILIGENIIITILENREGRMQIGIEAPKHIKVLRSELHKENLEELNHSSALYSRNNA